MKNRIRETRQAAGESQRELAAALGVAPSTLSYWENGAYEPDFTSISKIADRYGVSVDYILCRTDMPKDATGKMNAVGVVTPLYGVKTRSVPVLGNVACGMPKMANEEHEAMVAVGAEVQADFCLRAKGDSMIGDRIHDGDMVFVRSQPEVENGEIAVVVIGDEATLKHVLYYEDRKMLVLRPSNPNYEDITYMGDELEGVTILGKAVAFQAQL